MKNLIAVLVALIVVLALSIPALALEAGPFVLSGKVTSSNDKVVTLDLGEKQADVPVKFIPKALVKEGKVKNGEKLTIAFTEEQTKQIKIYKK